MFLTIQKEKKPSSRATTTTRRADKHSSSEPSTPSPRLPAQTSQASTEGIMYSLQNLSFQSGQFTTPAPRNTSGRQPTKPIPIPHSGSHNTITTLKSLPMPPRYAGEMKLGEPYNVRSPFTSMTTESVSSEGDDESTLAVNNSLSSKQPISPDSLGREFDYEAVDEGISQEILTSDDEIETAHGSTKRRASRSIFSSTPSPEPVRSSAITIPLPSVFKRSKSQN